MTSSRILKAGKVVLEILNTLCHSDFLVRTIWDEQKQSTWCQVLVVPRQSVTMPFIVAVIIPIPVEMVEEGKGTFGENQDI